MTIVAKFVMVKDLVRDICGLGLTIVDREMCCLVLGINIATTTNNNIGTIIVVVFDEMLL